MSVRVGEEDVFIEVLGKNKRSLSLAGGAESPALAGEGDEE
jgi:hypothetical protein